MRNVFEEFKSEEVKHEAGLGDICRNELVLFEQSVFCRKTHRPGDLVHQAIINDDSGERTVELTWR